MPFHITTLPWPSGHGPIEAPIWARLFCWIILLPWPSGHGPIEADEYVECTAEVL